MEMRMKPGDVVRHFKGNRYQILYFAKASVNRDVNATAYLVAAAFYLLMTYGLTKLFQYLEKKYSY